MRVLLKDRTLCVREMTAYANSADKHGFRAQITKALTLEAEEDDHPTAGHTIPDSIKVSDRTVLRWMHLCKACYGRHVKGFSDRRGDGDIVAELKQYYRHMKQHQKRMKLWVKDEKGRVVLADLQRSMDESIEDGTRYDFNTQYGVHGDPIPKPGQCDKGHTPETCRCHLPIIHIGQDEAIYWVNLLSGNEWTIDGERRLRPKSNGTGIMASSFVSEDRGLGLPVSDEEWAKVKHIAEEYHRKHNWFNVPEPLAGHRRQIGLVLFEYGSNKTKKDSTQDESLTSGWWNCAKFRYVVHVRMA
jgi:hypothetical protein